MQIYLLLIKYVIIIIIIYSKFLLCTIFHLMIYLLHSFIYNYCIHLMTYFVLSTNNNTFITHIFNNIYFTFIIIKYKYSFN